VVAGAPVINDAGVLGQVTRVYPLTAEVTLLTDKDAAIPVLNTRTQQRSAAFGGASWRWRGMELRFMSGNADVQPATRWSRQGIDGVYPPGLPVARVAASSAAPSRALPASAGARWRRPMACATCWCSSRWPAAAAAAGRARRRLRHHQGGAGASAAGR
jgi:hypothetical protein